MSLVKIEIHAEDKTGKAFKSAEERTKAISGAISEVSAKMRTIGLASVAGLTIAVGAFASFDSGVREIGTLLDDVTESSIVKMGKEIKALSVEYGQTLSVMTKARYDIASAGFTSMSDSALLLAESSKLATAGVSEVSRTADVLTSVLNSYELSASSAQKISDMLFTTVRLGKTTIEELASAMGTASAIAPTLGVGFDELSGAIATLTARGQSTDNVVTALQATMTALLKPSDALKNKLKELGFESGTALVKQVGLSEALNLLAKSATEAERASLFPNVRALKAVLPLAGTASKKFAENILEMRDSTEATETAFEKMTKGASFSINQLKERWRQVLINVGEAVSPILGVLTRFAEAFTSLSNPAQLAILGLGAFMIVVRAFAPLINLFKANLVSAGATIRLFGVGAKSASTGVKALSFSIKGLGTAIKTTLGATGLILTALTLILPVILGLDTAFADTTTNIDLFRTSIESLSFSEKEKELKGLTGELDDLTQEKALLLEKLGKKLLLTGSVSIKGQAKVDALTEEIETLSKKTNILSSDLFSLNLPKLELDNTGFENILNSLEASKTKVSGLETEYQRLTTAVLDSTRVSKSGFADPILSLQLEKTRTALALATGELKRIQPIVDAIDFSPFFIGAEAVKVANGELEKMPNILDSFNFSGIVEGKDEVENYVLAVVSATDKTDELGDAVAVIPNPFDKLKLSAGELQEKLEKTLTSLQGKEASLTIKAGIEFSDKGIISDALTKQLTDASKAVVKIQKVIASELGGIAEQNAIRILTIDKKLKSQLIADQRLHSLQLANEYGLTTEKLVAGEIVKTDKIIEETNRKSEILRSLNEEYILSDQEMQVASLEERLNAWNINWEKTLEGKKIHETAMNQIELNQLAKSMETINTLASGALDVFTKLSSIRVSRSQKTTADQEKRENLSYEKQKKALIVRYTVEGELSEAGKAKLAELEENHTNRITAIQDAGAKRERDIARRMQPIKLAQAISNTALGVTQALKTGDFVSAILIGILGGIEVATIASQPYALGGIVGGSPLNLVSGDRPLGAGESIARFTPIGNDTIPAMLEIGEAVIPKSKVERYSDIISGILNDDLGAGATGFAGGGFVGSGGEIPNTITTDNEVNAGDTITNVFNVSIRSDSLDPQASGDAIEDVVNSDAFQTAFKQAVNNKEIKIWASPHTGQTEVL